MSAEHIAEEQLAQEANRVTRSGDKALCDAEIKRLRSMISKAEDQNPNQQWTKAELENWCHGWCRTPHTTLKAFIDAGFCSDQQPSREEMRLLRQSDTTPVSTTKPVMSAEVREIMAGLLKHSSPDGIIGDHFADKARILLHGSRPVEPTDGKPVWYRGWECGFHEQNARWGTDCWEAYLGGADPDAPIASAFTWEGLLDEIDDHYMTENTNG